MYAIIEDSGTQIKVEEGDLVAVDLRDLNDGQTNVEFDRVLMVGGEGEPAIGTPYVDGAKVTGELVETREGDIVHLADKIDVVKYRRRKGYRRKQGHRQKFLQVRITGINAG
ncbi:MAG TPA: 50S ribosomal protein L21 [Phycisphaeraceae bacterium]|nr:50S ribosomal protein L21 [Phycisphaeraceae bacterium]